MKILRFSIRPLFLVVMILAVFGAACSSQPTSIHAGCISALALRSSPAAYALFEEELDAIKVDNDFTRHAKDPSNYDVAVSETTDDFVYAFSLRPRNGQRILDGRSVYVVSKSDGTPSLRSAL